MKTKKLIAALLAALIALGCASAVTFAAQAPKEKKPKQSAQTKQVRSKFRNVMEKWIRTSSKKYEEGNPLTYVEFSAAYFSTEYIEAHVQDQAQLNLWTQQEMENYKYQYLNTLQLDKMIPILLHIDNSGPAMHMNPFDSVVKLRIGNKVYKPVDYDKRFNFRLMGEIEGLIFFPRFDEKTGKPLIGEEGKNKMVTLEINSFASPLLKNNIQLIWSVGNDDISKLYAGKTAARLENDRLLERLNKLKKDKAEVEAKASTIDQEINTIQKRLDEIQKQM